MSATEHVATESADRVATRSGYREIMLSQITMELPGLDTGPKSRSSPGILAHSLRFQKLEVLHVVGPDTD